MSASDQATVQELYNALLVDNAPSRTLRQFVSFSISLFKEQRSIETASTILLYTHNFHEALLEKDTISCQELTIIAIEEFFCFYLNFWLHHAHTIENEHSARDIAMLFFDHPLMKTLHYRSSFKHRLANKIFTENTIKSIAAVFTIHTPVFNLHALLHFLITAAPFVHSNTTSLLADSVIDGTCTYFSLISDKLLSVVPPSEVKSLVTRIRNLLQSLFPKPYNDLLIQPVQACLIKSLLGSNLLEAKLLGLKELGCLIKSFKQNEAHYVSLKPKGRVFDRTSLCSFCVELGIVENIFGNTEVHPELLKRSAAVAVFLAENRQLSKQNLELISILLRRAHKSIQSDVKNVLLGIWVHLGDEERLFAWNALNFSVQNISDNLDFLQELIKNSTNSITIENQFSLLPLYELVCHPSGTCFSIADAMAECLLYLGPSHQVFQFYMTKFMENLKSHQCSVGVLMVFTRLLHLVSTGKTSFIFVKDISPELCTLVLDDLETYMGKVSKSEVATSSAVIIEPFSHKVNVESRLNFLITIRHLVSIPFTVTELDKLWNLLVVESKRVFDVECLSSFLVNIHRNDLLSSGLVELIFQERIPQLDFTIFTVDIWNMLSYFFNKINLNEGRLKPVDDLLFVSYDQLIGLELIWKVFLWSTNRLVDLASELLIELLKPHPNYSQFAPELFQKFIQECFSLLSDNLNGFKTGNSRSELAITRILNLLLACLEEFADFNPIIPHSKEQNKYKNFDFTVIYHNLQQSQSSSNQLPNKCSISLQLPGRSTVGNLKSCIFNRLNILGEIPLRFVYPSERFICDQKPLGTFNFPSKASINVFGPSSVKMKVFEQALTKQDSLTWHPSILISKNDPFFTLLWRLLSQDSHISTLSKAVLEMLPSNSEFINQLIFLKTPLNQIISVEPLKLQYFSDIMLSLACCSIKELESGTDATKESCMIDDEKEVYWKERFIRNNEFHWLLNLIVQNFDFVSLESMHSEQWSTLQKLVAFVSRLTLHQDFSFLNFPTIEGESFTRGSLPLKAMDISSLPDMNSLGKFCCWLYNTASMRPEDFNLVEACLLLICGFIAEKPELLNTIFSEINFQNVQSRLISSDCISIREMARDALLFITNRSREHVCSNPPSVPAWTSKVVTMVDLVVFQLFEIAQNLDLSKTKELYEVILRSIHQLISFHSCQNFDKLADEILNGLIEQGCQEFDSKSPPDWQFIGRVRLLSIICRDCKSVAVNFVLPHPQFTQFLLNDCLFSTSNQEDQSRPLCKTIDSKGSVYKLLLILSDLDQNIRMLCFTVIDSNMKFFNSLESPWPKSWTYNPLANERKANCFCGLRNLSATCYLNSLIQQLYVIPGFRYDVLNCDFPQSTGSINSTNKVVQLQSLFASMELSICKFVDTQSFVANMEDPDGQPLNPYIQMDLHEFLSYLFDKIGEEMRKSNLKLDLFEHYFGGTLQHQIISQECPHESLRKENFVALSVPVHGRSSLDSCLDLLVEVDVLDGSNKFSCEDCSKKVAAGKNLVLDSLPNTLFVHLRRFDFDFEQMKKIKVYDRVEFPLEMSFYKWSSQVNDPDYYDFELSGVIVHAGSSDSGHYYSFARNRETNTWFLFNDSFVDAVDFTKNYQNWCFGGSATESFRDPATLRDVPSGESLVFSAYILVYERKNSVTDGGNPKVPLTKSKTVPEHFSRSIWENNNLFQRRLAVYEPCFQSFFVNLCSYSIMSFLKNVAGQGMVEMFQRLYAKSMDISTQLKGTNSSQMLSKSNCDLSVFDLHDANFVDFFKKFNLSSLLSKDQVGSLFEIFETLTNTYFYSFVHSSNREFLPQMETLLGFLCLISRDVSLNFVGNMIQFSAVNGVLSSFPHILISSSVPIVRQNFARIFNIAMYVCFSVEKDLLSSLNQSETQKIDCDQSVVVKFIHRWSSCLNLSRIHWRNYEEFFEVLYHLCSLDLCIPQLLMKLDLPTELIKYLVADYTNFFPFPFPIEFEKHLGDDKVRADYDPIFKLLHVIVISTSHPWTRDFLDLINTDSVWSVFFYINCNSQKFAQFLNSVLVNIEVVNVVCEGLYQVCDCIGDFSCFSDVFIVLFDQSHPNYEERVDKFLKVFMNVSSSSISSSAKASLFALLEVLAFNNEYFARCLVQKIETWGIWIISQNEELQHRCGLLAKTCIKYSFGVEILVYLLEQATVLAGQLTSVQTFENSFTEHCVWFFESLCNCLSYEGITSNFTLSDHAIQLISELVPLVVSLLSGCVSWEVPQSDYIVLLRFVFIVYRSSAVFDRDEVTNALFISLIDDNF
ncbi:hypothetical protein P9112_004085 [Eukaryota sp. TZLM1-RC]